MSHFINKVPDLGYLCRMWSVVSGQLVKMDKLERQKEFLKAAQPLWDQH